MPGEWSPERVVLAEWEGVHEDLVHKVPPVPPEKRHQTERFGDNERCDKQLRSFNACDDALRKTAMAQLEDARTRGA